MRNQKTRPEFYAAYAKPRPPYLVVGHACSKGKVRAQNEDFSAAGHMQNGGAYLVVCDGVGGLTGGAEAAHTAGDLFSQRLKDMRDMPSDAVHFKLLSCLGDTRRLFAKRGLQGRTTVIAVAIMPDGWAHYLTLGDGGLSITQINGQNLQLLVPHRPAGAESYELFGSCGATLAGVPHQGSLHLTDGSLVMAMSDGVSEIYSGTTPVDLFGRLQVESPHAVANSVLTQLENFKDEQGKLLHSDNLSLAYALYCSPQLSQTITQAYNRHFGG